MKDGGIVVNGIDYSALITNLFLAVIPSVLLCIYVYKMDSVEKEPTSMLFTLFFCGVLITIPAAYVEKTLIEFTGLTSQDYLGSFLLSFLIIALVEEGYKYLILWIGTWKSKAFDHKYDAIVYAVFISLGFATLENILYVYDNMNKAVEVAGGIIQNSQDNALRVAILRALISVPAHAFYAVASGYFLGHAKQYSHHNRRGKVILFVFLSIFVPILLHGTFDFLLLLDNNIILGIFFSFVALLYMVSYCSIKKVSKTEMIRDSVDTRIEVNDEANV